MMHHYSSSLLRSSNSLRLGAMAFLAILAFETGCDKKTGKLVPEKPGPVNNQESQVRPTPTTQTNQNPGGQVTDATPAPTPDGTLPAQGTGTPVVTSTLQAPQTPASLPATSLNSVMDEVAALIYRFDVKLNPIPGFQPDALEAKAEACANRFLGGTKFQSTQSSFTLINSVDFSNCMKENPLQIPGKQEFKISYALRARCDGVDFSIYNDKPLDDLSVRDTFCKDATVGEHLYNVTLDVRQYAADGTTLTRLYKRTKALQSKAGSHCSFTQAAGVRTYGDCMWADKTEGKDASIHFISATFNGVKGGFSERGGLTFTEGQIDVITDNWAGKIVFTPATGDKAQWSVINSKDNQAVSGQVSRPVAGTPTQTQVTTTPAPKATQAPVTQTTSSPTQQTPVQQTPDQQTQVSSLSKSACPATVTAENAIHGSTDVVNGSSVVVPRMHTVLGGDTFATGHIQVSSDNKDGYLAKVNSSKQLVWCYVYAKTTGTNEEGWRVHVINNRLYTVFSADGDDANGFKTTSGAYQTRYGTGGGLTTAYIAQIDIQSGGIIASTWFSSRNNPFSGPQVAEWDQASFRNDGRVQSLDITGLASADNQGNIRVTATVFGYAPGCNAYASDASRAFVGVLSSDLKQLTFINQCPR